MRGKCLRGEAGANIRLQQSRQLQTLLIERHVVQRRQARLPTKGSKIIGYRSDGIRRAAEQIDVLVAVIIHCVFQPAGRHELRQPHGTCIAAAQVQRIVAVAGTQQQIRFQLFTKEAVTRLGARVFLRKVKAQGRERIDHPHIAHMAAIDGFYPNDAHDDVRRHAVFALGTLQGGHVLAPELHPGPDANRLDKAAAIRRPVAAHPAPRWQDQARHAGQKIGIANGVAHIGFGQAHTLGNLLDLLHHVRALGVAARQRHGLGKSAQIGL